MSNLQSAKDTNDTIKSRILGSVCVLLYVILAGINEVIIKSSNLSIAQLSVGRFAVQLCLTILCWNVRKRVNCFTVCKCCCSNNATTNVEFDAVQNLYGNKPFICNIWLRGVAFAIMQLLFYIALILLPIGDLQCIFYQPPLWVVYVSFILKRGTALIVYISSIHIIDNYRNNCGITTDIHNDID
eukprot:472956_1